VAFQFFETSIKKYNVTLLISLHIFKTLQLHAEQYLTHLFDTRSRYRITEAQLLGFFRDMD